MSKETALKTIFVGNWDFGATEQSIRALFEPYGAVERVNIVTDRDTGQPRGFAFVEMTNTNEADQAINALNGTNLGERALNVNEAPPKPDRDGGAVPRPPPCPRVYALRKYKRPSRAFRATNAT